MRTLEQSKTPIAGVVGRWQVDDLHTGHQALLNEVFSQHQKVIAFIGTIDNGGSKKDPLDYPTRAAMLRQHYPSLITLPIPDHICDSVWSTTLDNLIRVVAPVGDVMLYGGRDSFIQHYRGRFTTIELDALRHPCGTDIRESVSRVVRDSADFRAGVIYGQYNRYPKVLPVVDIAVIRESSGGREVLLGTRKHEEGMRFPGGFVDPTDPCLEAAARRELKEETGLDIEVADLSYLGSFVIRDSRVGPTDSMLSSFFTAKYQFGSTSRAQADDDLHRVAWVPFRELNQIKMVPAHEVLRKALTGSPTTA